MLRSAYILTNGQILSLGSLEDQSDTLLKRPRVNIKKKGEVLFFAKKSLYLREFRVWIELLRCKIIHLSSSGMAGS